MVIDRLFSLRDQAERLRMELGKLLKNKFHYSFVGKIKLFISVKIERLEPVAFLLIFKLLCILIFLTRAGHRQRAV